MNQLPAIRPSDVPDQFEQRMHMARVFAESDLLPGHLRGKPANVLIILEGARALDVAAFWGLQSMYVVDGKLTMSAELMRGLVLRAGHQFRVIERTDKIATIEIIRHDDPRPYTVSFTAREAELAGLTGKTNWKRYPKAMLVARATSTGVRDHCPDVLFGVVYTPDELGADTDQAGNPVIDESGQRVGRPELTDNEVIQLFEQIDAADIGHLPILWTAVTDNNALHRTPPGLDSLQDQMLARLARELGQCKVKNEARNLWQLVKMLDLLGTNVSVKVGSDVDGDVIEVRKLAEVIESTAAALPDSVPVLAEEPVAEPALEGEIVEPDKPDVAAEIDTDNARQMRADAASSWEEVRDQLTDLEAEQRARAAAPQDGPDDAA